MRKNIPLLLLTAVLALPAIAQEIKLQDNPPSRYVVVKGDNLWDISGRFLKDPWRWPEIWHMNRAQIENPNLIYPGDVIVLDRSHGEPRLRLLRNSEYTPRGLKVVKLSPRVRTEALTATAIPAISPADIGPFLSKPLIVEKDRLKGAPTIIATEENRMMLGTDDTAYVQGLHRKDGTHWQIYRPAKPVIDPKTHKILGYQAIYLGAAKVTAFGHPSTIRITNAKEEIVVGDRLMVSPAKDNFVRYVPHAPSQQIKATVISGYESRLNELGGNDIVLLNRGSQTGVEIGDVLALYRQGLQVSPPSDDGKQVQLPNVRYGLVFVFRTFKAISYGLVVQASRAVHPGDIAINP